MDLRWIERTVNTAGRPCSQIGKKCPGSRERCAQWIEETALDDHNQPHPMPGCLFAWDYVIHWEARNQMISTQAALDKVATESQAAGAAIASAAMAASLQAVTAMQNAIATLAAAAEASRHRHQIENGHTRRAIEGETQ